MTGARTPLPKTLAKQDAQRKAANIHDELYLLVRYLDGAGARTAAAQLDDIVRRLHRWANQ